MGIHCNLWQIVSETIDDLQTDPSLGEEILKELHEYNEELPAEDKIRLDLDKAWDAISYLLKRNNLGPFPLFLKEGGRDVKAISEGAGVAREFNSDETKQIFKAIEGKTFSALCKGVSMEDFIKAEVYPFVTYEEIEDALGYVEQHWKPLVEFLKSASFRKRGLLTYFG